jgi:hypothetical protein
VDIPNREAATEIDVGRVVFVGGEMKLITSKGEHAADEFKLLAEFWASRGIGE